MIKGKSGGDRNVYIIAGPNGAGKTTFARIYLPTAVQCTEVVNADFIAGGLSPFAPEGAAIQAGKIMLERIRSLGCKGKTFGFETTLSGKSYAKIIVDLKNRGYHAHLYYLWLPSVELALDRIAARVKRGGHTVKEEVVRRRFGRSLTNFTKIYCPLVDDWTLFDNSTIIPKLIAYKEVSDVKILDSSLYDLIFQGRINI